MGNVFLHGKGGSGGGLNFQVVGSLQPPASPKENAIWIETDTPITGYEFSATAPAIPFEGLVWITTGTSSTVAFNALKKNGIQIYPLSAKQYIDGAWVDVTAKSYQGGEWVDWVTYLFNDGDLCEDITGGWTSSGWRYYSNQSGLTTPTIADTIALYGTSTSSGSQCGIAATVNMIDLTDVSTIWVHNVTSTGGGCTLYVMASKTSIQNNAKAQLVFSVQTIGTDVPLDVSSLTGSYYIVLCAIGSTTFPNPSLEVSEVWLEK